MIWYSGRKYKHQQGVAFIVKKEIVKSVINVEHISSRIIYIRSAATPMNLSIIQVYSPTADYEDDIIEEFYEQIEDTTARIPKKDFMIIQGDWNEKVDSDGHEIWSKATGRYGLGNTNQRRYRLLEFAQKHKLRLSNTLHPHKKLEENYMALNK